MEQAGVVTQTRPEFVNKRLFREDNLRPGSREPFSPPVVRNDGRMRARTATVK